MWITVIYLVWLHGHWQFLAADPEPILMRQ